MPRPMTSSEMGKRSHVLARKRLGEQEYLRQQRERGCKGGWPLNKPKGDKKK